jgi:hypothetical protein
MGCYSDERVKGKARGACGHRVEGLAVLSADPAITGHRVEEPTPVEIG